MSVETGAEAVRRLVAVGLAAAPRLEVPGLAAGFLEGFFAAADFEAFLALDDLTEPFAPLVDFFALVFAITYSHLVVVVSNRKIR